MFSEFFMKHKSYRSFNVLSVLAILFIFSSCGSEHPPQTRSHRTPKTKTLIEQINRAHEIFKTNTGAYLSINEKHSVHSMDSFFKSDFPLKEDLLLSEMLQALETYVQIIESICPDHGDQFNCITHIKVREN